ncbi:MAG: DUF1127 domain-containing protein [Rhodospirillales bacterium]|nr:DUF1127 domain-containing protein [Rhodospirillales bacterium]
MNQSIQTTATRRVGAIIRPAWVLIVLGAHGIGVLAGKIGHVFRRWRLRRARYRAMMELWALDDVTLKDIGLHRTQVESVVLTGLCRESGRKRLAGPR